jgi:hypothetical protein
LLRQSHTTPVFSSSVAADTGVFLFVPICREDVEWSDHSGRERSDQSDVKKMCGLALEQCIKRNTLDLLR